MFVLDINELCAKKKSQDEEETVSWQIPVVHFSQAPPDTILYSLTKGIDEILLFGGMELDSPFVHLKPTHDQDVKHRVSNKLYLLKPSDLFISAS